MIRRTSMMLLLAACGGDAEIVVADGAAFPVAPFWDGIPAGGAALVTNNYSDTLSVIDLASGDWIGDLPVGLNPVEREGPHHDAVSPDGAWVYVGISNFVPGSGSGPHGTHGNGAAEGYALQIDTRDLSLAQDRRIDRSPGDVTFLPGIDAVAFSHFDVLRVSEALTEGKPVEATRATVAVLDAETLEMIESVTVCATPHGLRATEDGSRLYVACYGSDEIAIVDTGTFAVQRVPVADDVAPPPNADRYQPNSVHVSPSDGLVWVTLFLANEVRVYDPVTGAMDDACRIDVGGSPYFGMFLDNGATFAVPVQSTPGALAFIDTASCTESARLDLEAEDCEKPHMLLLGRDGETGPAYLVCEGDRIDPGTFVVLSSPRPDATVERVVPVGRFPDGAVLIYPGLGISPP